MEIYLDNSATTKVRKEVLDEMIDVYVNNYGNPSSIHRKGLKIEKKIEEARESVARIINSQAKEVYFTGGGTESNNIAIFGHLSGCNGNYNVITTEIEHPSVYNIFKHFENKINVRYVNTDDMGKIDLSHLKKLIDDETLLVSFILVNNELGTVQNLSEIVKIIKEKNKKTKIHVDAIQAYGKIKIDVKKIPLDTISFSSHKIHGPKGVGGLYIHSGCNITPVIFGGNQENGIRPGTENTPGIVGFGKACDLVYNEFDKQINKLYELKTKYEKSLSENICDMKINNPAGREGAPHILNLSFSDIKGEVLVHYLEDKEIYVSTGSACSSRVKKEHRVLNSINLDRKYIDGTIRLSLGYFNSFDEIEYVVDSIKQSVDEIRCIMKI